MPKPSIFQAAIGRHFRVKLGAIGIAVTLLPMIGIPAQSSLSAFSPKLPEPGLTQLPFSPQRLAQRERRTALVIGNADYGTMGILSNPVNDATDVAQALQNLGFEVTLLKNATKRQTEEAIEQFAIQLRPGGVGLLFYAGHGVQVNGENYLIPTDANIKREKDVQYEAIPLGKILSAMEDAKNPINLVLLDACRNNPFTRSWRSSVRGLASVQSAEGTFISFSAAPGQTALDGDGDSRNSPYTASLLEHIKTPGISVSDLFQQVRKSVRDKTNRQQITWDSSSLIGNFVFQPVEGSPPNSSRATSTPQQLPPTSITPSKEPSQPVVLAPRSSLSPQSPQPSPTTPTAQPENNLPALRQPASQIAAVSHNEAGVHKLVLGDQAGAIKDFTQALQADPNYAEAYYNRGNAKYFSGDKAGAIEDFNHYLQLNPNNKNAYISRGFAKLDIGDKAGALNDFNQALKIDPSYAPAYSARGTAKYISGDRAGAQADYRESARLFQNQGNQQEYQTVKKLLSDLEF